MPRSSKRSTSLSLPTKMLYAPLLSPHTCHILLPSHYFLFDHLNDIWWGVRAQSSLLCILLHSPIILCHLVLIIFLSILYFNTVSICLYPKLRDKASHPYKKQAKLQFCVSLYFWIANWKAEDSAPNDSTHSLAPVCCQFWHSIVPHTT